MTSLHTPQGKVAMAQTFGFMLYVLGLGLAICVLDFITAYWLGKSGARSLVSGGR